MDTFSRFLVILVGPFGGVLETERHEGDSVHLPHRSTDVQGDRTRSSQAVPYLARSLKFLRTMLTQHASASLATALKCSC